NRTLVDHVTAHGTVKWEPVTKTTRGGSQTGELLDDRPGPVAALETMVRAAIADYLAAIPPDADHPFLSTAPEDWHLTFWATLLEEGGQRNRVRNTRDGSSSGAPRMTSRWKRPCRRA
ncbi:MAG: hypothetical protein AMJ59_08555, partial [Gammaproteobacteria bacterium SG8_31]